jgi:predicted  nucleic acid-binding Zn-ribbon protein
MSETEQLIEDVKNLFIEVEELKRTYTNLEEKIQELESKMEYCERDRHTHTDYYY